MISPALRPRIQAKLETSSPNDADEREADEVAEDAVGGEPIVFSALEEGANDPNAPPSATNDGGAPPDRLMRSAEGASAPAFAGPDFADRLRSRLGRGSPLPSTTRSAMETRLGADFGGVRIHNDSQASDLSRGIRAKAFTYGRDIFFGAGQFGTSSVEGRKLLAHELTHVRQQSGERGPLVHRKPEDSPKPRTQTLQIHVTVETRVSGQEFLIRTVMQYDQVSRAEAERLIAEKKYSLRGPIAENGVPADQVGKPIAVSVLVNGFSGSDSKAAASRTAEMASLSNDARKAINDEADKRFWSRTGSQPGRLLTSSPADAGLRQAWLRTREEVIQDREAIDRLPPKIKGFIAPGSGSVAPRDYKTALRIADKVSSFTDDDWALYNRRARTSTSDYAVVERSVDAFLDRKAAESKTMDRIRGKETLRQKIKDYQSLERMMLTPSRFGGVPIQSPQNAQRLEAAKADLDNALSAAGFSSIAEFESAQAAFVDLFKKRAVEITLMALEQSERVVVAERKRYENATENSDLFGKMEPVRSADSASRQAARESMPTPMQLKMDSTNSTPAQKRALTESIEQSRRAETLRSDLAGSYPILKDPELRTSALNVKNADELGATLRGNADDRLAAIQKTRINVLQDANVALELDRIVALTKQELEVTPDSIYDQTLKDYQSNIKIERLIIGLAVAALAIGLGALTFGGGTVAVLAGAAGLGLSLYQVNEEWEKYAAGRAAAHTDFDKALSVSSEDPSAVWVAVALIGAGLDGAALVKAFKAVGPAAKILETTGDVAQFEAELAKAAGLSESLQKSVARAGRAEAKSKAASEELVEAIKQSKGRMYSGGVDPDVMTATIKAAYYAAEKRITDFEVFLRELRLKKFAKTIDFDKLDKDQMKALREAFDAGAKQYADDAAKAAKSLNPPRNPIPGDADFVGPIPRGSWRLTPQGMGAHLVERVNVRGRSGLSALDSANTPRFYPAGSPEAAGAAHVRLHNATKNAGIALQGGNPAMTDAQILQSYRQAYSNPTLDGIRGDLRTPNGSSVIASNVTPGEAFEALIRWLGSQ